jgi:hypothetical protein
MTKRNLGKVSVVLAAMLSVNAQATETLNLPYSAGVIQTIQDTCGISPQGGLIAVFGGTCYVDVPVALSSSRTIKQITTYYGSVGAGSSYIQAWLGFKDLRAAASNNAFESVQAFYWSSTNTVADAAMAGQNLMAQSGIYPYITYPDAFAVDSTRAYFVRVVITAQSEFFGVRVTYD